ncbi:pyridoxal 5'-phosphate synthase [Saccharomycopsis crataegensis]|uniref:Pyridoxal 5'-phosphate synthase n=1 Tax=Saccharomycopsis crataegensis TaxID=43959 RepID=A0AAV5QPS2_9ASCO|nr:pyridoxal 5'-phosphate synthase [Saccharomycopsis crataegensis]
MTIKESDVSASVVNLLKNAKYAHLATANPHTYQPNVSLMNYAYMNQSELHPTHQQINSSPQTSYIIFSVNKSATNFENIKINPKVSILIHDWVTAKSTLSETETPRGTSSTTDISPLLKLLQNMNQSELSTISVTLNGEAILVEDNADAENYYKELLLKSYPDSKIFIEGDNNVIIMIEVRNVKIVDTQNNVQKH